jgi:hypothetical protein
MEKMQMKDVTYKDYSDKLEKKIINWDKNVHSIYAMFENKKLIYIGYSANLYKRLGQHRTKSGWFDRVTKILVERTSASNMNREQSLIDMYDPEENKKNSNYVFENFPEIIECDDIEKQFYNEQKNIKKNKIKIKNKINQSLDNSPFDKQWINYLKYLEKEKYNKIDNILTYEQYILVKQLGYSENSSAIKKIKTKKEKFIIKDAIESFKRAEEYYENEQRKNTTRPSHAAALD